DADTSNQVSSLLRRITVENRPFHSSSPPKSQVLLPFREPRIRGRQVSVPLVPFHQLRCFPVTLVARRIAQRLRVKPYPRQTTLPCQILRGEKYTSTCTSTANLR